MVEVDSIYDTFSPLPNPLMEKLKVNFDPLINKPFFIGNIEWSNQSQYDTLKVLKIPMDLLVNPLIKKPFESTVNYRAKLCLMFQIAGTPMHSGTIIASAVPRGVENLFSMMGNSFYPFATLMCNPHVFLSANESTSVCLDVPFYSSTPVIRTDNNHDTVNFAGVNYAEVHVVVLNPMGVPTSGSTKLTISVHAMFREGDFYVPHVDATFVPNSNVISKIIDIPFTYAKKVTGDIIDAGRSFIREYTGLHNKNIAVPLSRVVATTDNFQNYTDAVQFFEKLDLYATHERILDNIYFFTHTDEMDILHILKKPQYLGTFDVNATSPVGKVVWSRPNTPLQRTTTLSDPDLGNGRLLLSPFEILGSMARFWRGGLKIHIQAVMSNFHFVKLLVAKNYSPVLESTHLVPQFTDVGNLITDTLEFSSGGQVQTVDIDYMATTRVLPLSFDLVTNGLQNGLYYIYLAQPLVFNGSVPLSVSFNVFVSAGDDFEYYGYCPQPTTVAFRTNSLEVVVSKVELKGRKDYSQYCLDGGDIIIVNSHSVEGLKKVTIDDIEYKAKVISTHDGYDLAIVKLPYRESKKRVPFSMTRYLKRGKIRREMTDQIKEVYIIPWKNSIKYTDGCYNNELHPYEVEVYIGGQGLGSCGSLLIDEFFNIIGHHVAIDHTDRFGVCLVWSEELIEWLNDHWVQWKPNAEVLATSSQEGITINTSETNRHEEVLMRPLTNIRDIARKLHPVGSIRMNHTTDQTLSTVEVDLGTLLGMNNSVKNTAPFVDVNTSSVLNLISGLYRGFTGGLKLVFEIDPLMSTGVGINVLYYPPGGIIRPEASVELEYMESEVALPSNAFLRDIQAQRTAADFPEYPSSLPRCSKYTEFMFPPATTEGRYRAGFKRELIVPNYIFSDIIGDLNARPTNPLRKFACGNLGSVVISVEEPLAKKNGFLVKIYAGITDEARFGMQSLMLPRFLKGENIDLDGSGSHLYLLSSTFPSSTPCAYRNVFSEYHTMYIG